MRLLQLSTVLVADDLTSTSDGAMRTARTIGESAGAALHIAHVAPRESGIIANTGKRSEAIAAIEETAARAGIRASYTPHVLTGSAAESIGELADRISADAIICGRRSAKSRVPIERPLGGTAYAIITHSLVPCLAVNIPLTMPVRRVVVAIDCSEASRGAMVVALSWTSALRGRDGTPPLLTALRVHDPSESDDSKRLVDHELDIVRRSAGDWAGVAVSGVTRPGTEAASVITDLAASVGADLIVLGTRGLSPAAGGRGSLGSVSAAVLGAVKAPVLLVPPAVWRNYARDVDVF